MTRKKEDTRYLFLRGETWYLRIKINGKLLIQTLRTSSIEKARELRDQRVPELTTRMDEKARLKSIQRQLAGIELEEKEEKESPLRGPLLVDAFNYFEKDPERRHCSKYQMDAHRRHWRDFIAWLLKHHPEVQYCRQVTREICREWATEKLKDARATNTYNRHISTVRYVFTSLNGIDEQIHNPMERIHKRVDFDCVSKEPFTPEELQAIFKSMNHEFRLLAAVGLYTTLRLGSARMLTWEMIDKDLSYVHAIHEKTGADATQKICAELREWLEAVPPEKRHGFLCPSFAARTKSYACCVVKDCLQKCGIQTQRQMEGLNGQIRTVCVKGFHSFRHTGITMALQHGATVAQVKRLAGHASERMQERYTHLTADDAGAAPAAPAAPVAPAQQPVQATQPQPQAPAAPAVPAVDPEVAVRARILNVMTILAAQPDLQRRAVAEGWDEARAATELNAANAASRPQATFVQTAPSANAPVTNNILLAAALQTAGTPEQGIIAAAGQQALEQADHRFRGGLGLQQLVLEVAAANGHNPGTYRLNGSNWFQIVSMARRPSVQGAFSNVSLDGILGGVIQRRLLDGYGVVDQSCFDIAAVKPVSDFREIESYRLKLGADGKAAFAKVPANGQLSHGTLAEDAFTNQADTYGMMLSITRKDYINDNLGAFTQIPFLLGQQAGMALCDVFWKEFMNNSDFFKADNGNILTGATNALGVDGLSAALKAFRLLKDNGVLLGGRPAILLVGPSNEVTAGKLYTDSAIIATGVASSRAVETSGNPHKGKYKPVVSPYLEDTTFTGNSATAYYLLADPRFRASIEIVFLDGVRTPHIESAETEFSTLGTQFRCYYDFGVRKQDPLSGVKVTGAN